MRCKPRELVAARPDTLAGYGRGIGRARVRELPRVVGVSPASAAG